MIKIAWEICTKLEELWVEALMMKYTKGGGMHYPVLEECEIDF